MTLSSSTATLLESKPELKLGLQSVLQSLDVGLEDELARYRRQRRLQEASAAASAPARAAAASPVGSLEKSSEEKSSEKTPVAEARQAIAQLNQSLGLDAAPAAAARSVRSKQDSPHPQGTTLSSVSTAQAMPQSFSGSTEPGQASSDAAAAVPLESSLVHLGATAEEPATAGTGLASAQPGQRVRS